MTQRNMARMCPATWVAGLLAGLGEVMGVMTGQRKGDQEKEEESHLETGSKIHVMQTAASLSWARRNETAPNCSSWASLKGQAIAARKGVY